jgi:hypothetical protein
MNYDLGNCVIATPFPAFPPNESPPNMHDAGILSQSLHFTNTSAFSISSPPDDEGWVTLPSGELLFWVPPDNQLGFLRPGTLSLELLKLG